MIPGRDLSGATADDLDPTSTLLDAVLAADPSEQHALLERLSAEFELCVYGLGEVRKAWEDAEGGPLLV